MAIDFITMEKTVKTRRSELVDILRKTANTLERDKDCALNMDHVLGLVSDIINGQVEMEQCYREVKLLEE